MINQQIIDYIKQQLEQDIDKEEIRKALLNNGWQETDINDAFNYLAPASPQLNPLPQQTQSNQPFPPAMIPNIIPQISPQKNPRQKHTLKIAVILLLSIILIGGAIYIYYTYIIR